MQLFPIGSPADRSFTVDNIVYITLAAGYPARVISAVLSHWAIHRWTSCHFKLLILPATNYPSGVPEGHPAFPVWFQLHRNAQEANYNCIEKPFFVLRVDIWSNKHHLHYLCDPYTALAAYFHVQCIFFSPRSEHMHAEAEMQYQGLTTD